MVFESLVVELINRYLGDFVENLDTSQLKIGIWGGEYICVRDAAVYVLTKGKCTGLPE